MIDDIRKATGHGIRPICTVLGVARSSYYHAAEPTPTMLADTGLGDRIENVFKHHRGRYGYRRIHSELSDSDVVCAPARIRRIMEERGLRAIQPKTYIPRTSDGRADKLSPNLLLGKTLPEQTDRVWASDITYIPTAQGWRYLAVIIDLSSRRVAGCSSPPRIIFRSAASSPPASCRWCAMIRMSPSPGASPRSPISGGTSPR